MVLLQGATLTLLGIALGFVASLGLTNVLGSFLYGVQPLEVWTYTFVCMFVMASGMLAAYLPAMRAVKVDPIVTLRHG